MHKIVFLILCFISLQSCSAMAPAPKPSSTPAPKPSANAAPSTTPKKATGIAPKIGDNFVTLLKSYKFNTPQNQEVVLSTALKGKKSLIMLFKPGCVYCESVLAVLNGTKSTIKPQMFTITDMEHATVEEFKSKATAYPDIKSTWLYDTENVFHNQFDMGSYPRFVVTDETGKITQIQIGLVMPEDRKSLEGKEFADVLQDLASRTVAWMQTL
ncbi:MAG: hypothetical protein LW817_02305 [Candidatus Caenarcaniphilales bacterium]|nr:hypothetical protein [Candidatus Caenarcaniphilales bacterium]